MASLCGNICLPRCIDHAEAKKVLVGLVTMAAGDPQECLILTLTSLCCDRVDDSKWAIIVVGGIPHLVQMLETGSQKAREGAAHILWNLCCHSEDIRAPYQKLISKTISPLNRQYHMHHPLSVSSKNFHAAECPQHLSLIILLVLSHPVSRFMLFMVREEKGTQQMMGDTGTVADIQRQ
ncbi:hypothetical protein D5086_026718 [Populus alba]|uniref:Uncharacterized protein n=1 Tax=Populus alba TaxID=43335 RepID=A0ACC4B4A5_POPAL